MADPKTWTLIQMVKESLAVIAIADGYNTDAGAVVTDEPHQVPKDAGIAMAVAFLSAGRALDPAVIKTHRLVTIVVIGKVSTQLDNAQSKLHELMNDIERAMDQQQGRYPEGIQYPQFVSTEVLPPPTGSGWIGAQVRLQSHVPKR